MTDREIKKARETLPKWENGNPPVYTSEEKQLDRELSCREMINSLLIYHGRDGISMDNYFGNRYLSDYVKELGQDTVDRLCSEQLKDFEKAVVYENVGTDSEGVTYNSIKWADEMSLEDKLADAVERSEQQGVGSDKCKVDILQIKVNDDTYGIRYLALSHFPHGVGDVEYKNYEKVYGYSEDKTVSFEKEAEIADFLELIFIEFNECRPKDFAGHSLSVSDVVVLSQGNECKAFYCDSFGFEGLPDKFVAEFKRDLAAEKELASPDIEM